jgi:hypothetical protein
MDFTNQAEIIDQVIRKYKPQKPSGSQSSFDPTSLTKEGLKEVGLEKMAKDLNKLSQSRFKHLADVRAPKKKLFVMIIGNHSAGKSSFINWYAKKEIAKTNVSIETVGINLIMHGSSNVTLACQNTMKVWPFLKDLIDKQTNKERFAGLL